MEAENNDIQVQEIQGHSLLDYDVCLDSEFDTVTSLESYGRLLSIGMKL